MSYRDAEKEADKIKADIASHEEKSNALAAIEKSIDSVPYSALLADSVIKLRSIRETELLILEAKIKKLCHVQ